MSDNDVHRSHRAGWLSAAVLGANDGIVSTSSLIIGVAAASTTKENIILAGVAGLVSGAMSMASSEYVSVSSKADIEHADLAREKKSLEQNFELEKTELTNIYEARGLDSLLAEQVAEQLMQHDALGAHARDEIGLSESSRAQPTKAALYSAAAFTIGGGFPLLIALFIPISSLILIVAILSLCFLALLGGLAARTGGASITTGAFRVTFWGALAMTVTAGVGSLFGVVP